MSTCLVVFLCVQWCLLWSLNFASSLTIHRTLTYLCGLAILLWILGQEVRPQKNTLGCSGPSTELLGLFMKATHMLCQFGEGSFSSKLEWCLALSNTFFPNYWNQYTTVFLICGLGEWSSWIFKSERSLKDPKLGRGGSYFLTAFAAVELSAILFRTLTCIFTGVRDHI